MAETSRRKSVKALVLRADAVLQRLEKNARTSAEINRIADVSIGLQALDEQQSQLRAGIDRLVAEYENPNAPDDECAALLRDLRKLAKDGGRYVTVVTAPPKRSADR